MIEVPWLWIFSIFWLAGFLKQMAYFDAKKHFVSKEMIEKGIKDWHVYLVIFFTWPYFYFYFKSK